MRYHYIYKTVHPNGRYYIGRHSTANLDDNYLGSGVWVSGIKNKSILKKEILVYADNTSDLKKLEEKIIKENYNHPLCMNRGLGSQGWTSEESSFENRRRVLEGTHNFIGGDIPRKNQKKRVEQGTHQWLGDKNPSVQLIKNGTHFWLSEEHKQKTGKRTIIAIDRGEHPYGSIVCCPYCNKTGQKAAMFRWHMENCKNK